MKINGFNPYTAGPLVFTVEELNLKEGQKIIGKVINTTADEALLEMAGRSIRAKIEGNPQLEAGAVLKFQVNKDSEGRVVLKIFSNLQETNEPAAGNASVKPVLDPNLQKAIATALSKEGLPVTRQNIEKFTQLFQNFLNKYQQPVPPEVLTFIAAQKWPVNTETIMTSWIFQDSEVRDLLWNILKQTESGPNGMQVLAKLMMGMSSKPEEVQTKLQTLIKQLENLVNTKGNQNQATSGFETREPGLISKQFILENKPVFGLAPSRSAPNEKAGANSLLSQAALDKNTEVSAKTATASLKNQALAGQDFTRGLPLNELKSIVSRLADTFGNDALRDKIEVLLDRNLSLNKAVLQENSVNGNYNLIPLLVNDSQNILHELLIKWQEEPSEKAKGTYEQVLRVDIPTENLGEIRLRLRTGKIGAQITFQVENDDVRKYLLQNLNELKEAIPKKDLNINVALKDKENISIPVLYGVDLWM